MGQMTGYSHRASGIYRCATGATFHVINQLKACSACFPMVPEVNCSGCDHYSSRTGLCMGKRKVHEYFACTLHTSSHGKS